MKINGIVHVGAHYGEEVAAYVDMGIEKMILFEPLEDNLKVLRSNCPEYAVIFPYALGEHSGVIEMYLSSNNLESSSILKPKEHLTQYPFITFGSTSEVEIRRLDQFEEAIEGCNFLNMDVQGYELSVLKGAGKFLNKLDYIYCEVNRSETYENNALVEEIDSYLSQYGFSRKETDWSGGIWGDALYVSDRIN